MALTEVVSNQEKSASIKPHESFRDASQDRLTYRIKSIIKTSPIGILLFGGVVGVPAAALFQIMRPEAGPLMHFTPLLVSSLVGIGWAIYQGSKYN